MNVSASLNAFKLLIKPSICIPHSTISTFNDLQIPVSKAFMPLNDGNEPEIRAVVLDKDDCFAIPKETVIYKPYYVCVRILYKQLYQKKVVRDHSDCDAEDGFRLLPMTCIK